MSLKILLKTALVPVVLILACGSGRMDWVMKKNYPLAYAISSDADAASICRSDATLKSLSENRFKRVAAAEAGIDAVKAGMWSDEQIKESALRLSSLYTPDNALGKIIRSIRKDGDYVLYDNLPDNEFIARAFIQDAEGMNTAISRYALGEKNRYAGIDSISFDVNSRIFRNIIEDIFSTVLKETSRDKVFFDLPMQIALRFMEASERDEPADCEPLAENENRLAVKSVKRTKWDKYPYSALLVPGQGPDIYNQPLSPNGRLRCAYAAALYKEGKAPFIIVSGSRVHPRQTPFIEAVEMKRFLVEECGIPSSAIFIEPHARHTTTNFRNAARIMLAAGIPMDKKALVTSSKYQIDYIVKEKFSSLCITMMGVLPFELGSRLNDRELEFIPKACATQRAPIDPLDP